MPLSDWRRRGILVLLVSAGIADSSQSAPPGKLTSNERQGFAQAEPAVVPGAPAETAGVASPNGVAQAPDTAAPLTDAHDASRDRPSAPEPVPAPATKPAPPPQPWKPLYFDNDFSYKGKPNAPHFLGEELKNMPLDGVDFLDGSTLSVGGEIRHRYMDELNRLRPGGPGRSTYNLWRWRQYVDFKVRDQFRVYVEMIDASIFDQELPVTGIDENRWDIQNAFLDVKLGERDDKPIYFRAGRQELLYGTPQGIVPGGQMVLSPLDWGNTRRNFEGFKLISKGTTWDVDVFAVRPVNTATPTGATGGRPVLTSVLDFDNSHDKSDPTRWLTGAYTVYRGIENQTIEPYYIWLQTAADKHVAGWADGNRHSVGLRWTTTNTIKDCCDKPCVVLASDVEGAYQFGADNGLDVSAGFFTSKLGATLSQVPWTPNFQFIYYFGSGDNDPTDGVNQTYDVYWPLNHAWWGIIDNLAGQNLHDFALQATVKPHARLTFLSAIHWFDADSNSDTIYNVAGAPTGPAGGGKNIGEELDLIATYAYSPNFDVQLGYSWFWYGNRIKNTALNRDDATQFYLQTSLRY
jgi:hypothetical protein